MSDETEQVIECPGHGPMCRITRMGALVDIRCETCWNRPIDLLESVRIDPKEQT